MNKLKRANKNQLLRKVKEMFYSYLLLQKILNYLKTRMIRKIKKNNSLKNIINVFLLSLS